MPGAVHLAEMSQITQDEVKARLLTELGARREIRWGEARRLGDVLGTSQVTLRAAMRGLGVRLQRPRLKHCRDCGKPLPYKKTDQCYACRVKAGRVTLTCTNCGKRFERRRSKHEAFLRRLVTHGRRGPVCSGACRKTVVRGCAWCGAEIPPRWPSTTARLAFCGAVSDCQREAMRALPPRYWPRLGPALIPMKDHLNAVARLRVRAKGSAGSPSSP